MSSQTALVILTYVDARRPGSVRQRLPDAVRSLEATGYRAPVVIVDDGSNCPRHLEYLDLLSRGGRYDVVRRKANGGISRAKNTCLRVIRELTPEIAFLAEDDILFHPGWDAAYSDAMRRSRIHHFSWFLPDDSNRVVACNSCLVTATSGLLGLLLTMTRDVLERVGGFKVLPHRYGYEHIQWTYRNIVAGLAPFPADIVDSARFITRNKLASSVDDGEIQKGIADNCEPGHRIDQVFEPLIE